MDGAEVYQSTMAAELTVATVVGVGIGVIVTDGAWLVSWPTLRNRASGVM
jgi:hypothetical protein